MTRRPGHDGDVPVFDAIETPLAARPAGVGREPLPGLGPARGAGVAVVVLALLVVGIVVDGLSLAADPTESPGPSSNASGVVTPSGSAAIEACRSPRQGEFPAVAMGVAGTASGVKGLFGFGTGYGQPTDPPGWLVPPSSSALATASGADLVIGSGLELVVGSNPNVTAADPSLEVGPSLHPCFRHLVATYRPTLPRAREAPTDLFDADLEPATGRIVLIGVPDGDWIVRVAAAFETFGAPTSDLVTITYFRIFAGEGPFVTDAPSPTPAPSPLVSPAVPCGTLLPTPDVGVSLFIGSDLSVTGAVGPDAIPAEVHARMGDEIRMIVDGEACAVSWSIALSDDTNGANSYSDSIANSAEDPAYVAQSRWELPIAGRTGILTARLHFQGGLEITRAWNFVSDPFEIPALFLIGPSGTRFEASAGCGLSLELSNGYQAADSCGSIGYTPGPGALRVPAYRPIQLDLPGWQISSWGASCGEVTGGNTPQFESPDGCGLGSAYADNAGPLLDPPAFILSPGDTFIQISIGAVDGDGNRFYVPYYAHVVAR